MEPTLIGTTLRGTSPQTSPLTPVRPGLLPKRGQKPRLVARTPTVVVDEVRYLGTTASLGGVATWQVLRCSSFLHRVAGRRILRGSSAFFCPTTFTSFACLASFTDDNTPLHLRMQLAVVRHRPSPLQNDGIGGSRR